MAHYFENDSTLEHKYQLLNFNYRDNNLQFKTDIGVFSKNNIDYGSKVLLNSLDDTLQSPILDVGCGYGTMGLSVAKEYRAKVTMVDVNERAVDLALENAKLNQVEDLVQIKVSNIYEQVTGKFGTIITNPPIRAGKEVVHQIIAQANEYLLSGGSIWVVIQKKQGAPSAKKLMLEVYGNCQVVTKDKGYYILKSTKN